MFPRVTALVLAGAFLTRYACFLSRFLTGLLCSYNVLGFRFPAFYGVVVVRLRFKGKVKCERYITRGSGDEDRAWIIA